MDLGTRLRRRWYLVVLSAIVAIAVAGATLVTFKHGSPHEKRTIYHVAQGQVLVDTDPSTLTNVTATSSGLGDRAELIAEYATGPAIVRKIAARAGVPITQLSVQAETTSPTKTGGSSSKGITVGGGPNSVVLQTLGQRPTIQISAQAHTGKAAKVLVNSTISALRRSLLQLQNAQPYNHPSSASAATTTSTTTSTAATAKGSKRSKNNGAAGANAAAAKRAAAAAAAAKQSRQVTLSKIVLRPIGGITVGKVVVTPKTSKAIGYGVGAFIILLLLILVLDNLLTSRVAIVRTASSPAPKGE